MPNEGGNRNGQKRELREDGSNKRKRIRKENKKRKLEAYVTLAESNMGNQKKGQVSSQVEKKERTNPRITDEEFADFKKRKREIDKLKMAWPRLFLNYIGDASSLTVEPEKRSPLFMTDIQNALLYSIIHNHAPRMPRWARMIRTRKFSHVVTVLIEGVSLSDVMDASQLPQEQETRVGNGKAELKEGKKKDEDTENDCKSKDVSRGRNLVDYSYPAWLADVMPRTCRSMRYKVEVIAPAKYDVEASEDLTNIPLSVNRTKKIAKNFDGLQNALQNGIIRKAYGAVFPMNTKEREKKNKPAVSDKFDRRQLLLSIQDLYEYGYPLAIGGCVGYNDPEFTFTSDNYAEVSPSSPMFGVDCEMCMTVRRELELTSISVVSEKMELVYHKLVKPDNKIINYLTQFSGITPAMLVNVTTRLCDVQEDLKKLFPPDAILVGHSLNSDLKAMKMMHPYVIDSSLVYNLTNQRHKRTSLKRLTEQFLGENIQNNADGHDPTEDAGASLRLIQLKLKHDITFGDVIQGWDGDIVIEKEQEEEDIQAYKHNTEEVVAKSMLVQNLFGFGDYVKMAVLTTSACVECYSSIMTTMSQKVSYMEVLSGNKELSKKVAEVAITKDFTYAHMKIGSRLSSCTSVESRRHLLRKLDKQLARIHKASASKALIIFLFSGSTTDVPTDLCSNGFAMLGIKDLPSRGY